MTPGPGRWASARSRAIDRLDRLEAAAERPVDGRLAAAGHAVRAVARRPPDPAADRRVGRLVAAGAILAVVHPVLGVLVPAAALGQGWWRRRRGAQRAAAALIDSLPDVVDLLALAADGGATARGAVDAVARHGYGPLARAFGAALDDVDQRGDRLADRLGALTDELDPAVGPLVHPLVSAERYGTPMGPSLLLAGRDLRQLRRHRAEESIRRVPVKLVFPLVCCTLPAFGVLTILPLLAASFRHLEL